MGFIYYIAQCNKENYQIKIGYTNNIQRRIKELITPSPFNLMLLGYHEGTKEDEKMIQKKFIQFNTQREWFKLDSKIIDYCNQNTISNTFCELDDKGILRVYKTMKK